VRRSRPATARFRNLVILSSKHISRIVARVRTDVRTDAEKKFETEKEDAREGSRVMLFEEFQNMCLH